MNKCVCCMEAKPPGSGVSCGRHFFCASDITSCLETKILSSLPSLRSTNGDIGCGHGSCKNTLDVQEVAKRVSPQVWAQCYSAMIEAKIEKRVSSDGSAKEKLAASLMPTCAADQKSAGEEAVSNLVKLYAAQVRESCLNLRCPSCGTVYNDFTGCMALTCEICTANFCAYCHQVFDNSNKAHSHVRSCIENTTEDKGYFANQEAISAAQKRHRIRALRSRLKLLSPFMYESVVSELRRDLDDLGIEATDLEKDEATLRGEENRRLRRDRERDRRCFGFYNVFTHIFRRY